MKRTDCTIEEIEQYIHHKIKEHENDMEQASQLIVREYYSIKKKTLEDVLHAIDKIEFVNLNKENV